MKLPSKKRNNPAEKDGEAAIDEAVQAAAKPGWLARLKDRLGTKRRKERSRPAATDELEGDAPTERMPRPGEPETETRPSSWWKTTRTF